MKNLSELFNKYISVIDEVLKELCVKQNADEVKKNLVASSYLGLVQKVVEDPELKSQIETSSVNDNSSQQEIENAVEEIGKKLEESSFDYQNATLPIMRSCLEEFISKFNEDVTPEKTQKLQNIISENL